MVRSRTAFLLMLLPFAACQRKPAGYHLMVIGTVRPLVEGSNIRIAMHLSDGSIISTSARVKYYR